MKKSKFLFLFSIIAASLSFLSCSDDDKKDGNDGNGGNGNGALLPQNFGPKNVFEGKLVQTIADWTLQYNTDGLLESATDATDNSKITFTYPKTVTKETQMPPAVTMTYTTAESPEDNYTMAFLIGSNGFATRAQQTYSATKIYEWRFKYNEKGQLNSVERTEGENEVTTITYTDGNITNVVRKSDDPEEPTHTTSVKYTSTAYPNGIDNKGGIMLFDDTFGMDIDEAELAYYAGMLGQATKKLPLEISEIDEAETIPEISTFTWTLGNDGYPTKIGYKDGGIDLFINLTWK